MDALIEAIIEPWPWYVIGPGIAVVMLILGYWGRSFGISATNRTMCALFGAGKVAEFFDFEWRRDLWNVMFLLGAIGGGFIVSTFLSNHETMHLSAKTVGELNGLGITVDNEMIPTELMSWESLKSWTGILFMVVGGFLVGFGSRYAGGCTSGHAITGLSNLQLPSLIAVIGFFIGGLVMTHLIFPLIFG
jgi:uncharacterized membrane protein YedE/YeeE